MKIDLHTHILPPQIPDWKKEFGYGGFIQYESIPDSCDRMLVKDDGTAFRRVQPNCWDPDTRVEEMNKHQVNMQVLSTVPVMFSYWAPGDDATKISQYLNNHIASVVSQYPDRFIGLGTIPLQSPVLAAAELKRCVKELGLRGVQIGSHVNEWNLDAEELYPVYEAAQQVNCPIFVHPWDMPSGPRYQKYWLPWLVGMPQETSAAICCILMGGILEKFPKLKICFAHGGGAFPYTFGRIQHGYTQRPDLCATKCKKSPKSFLGKIYFDSLVHDENALKLLIDIAGEDNIILGSDYPFPLGEQVAGSLVKSTINIQDQIKEKILYKNVLKFLGVQIQK